MRNDLLYIDGELVDLDEDTKITLNIKSNLLTDLSKIVSNNSYTIKLPRTVRNQRIIEHADLPSSGKDYPRRYHQGRYFRNGVEIVPDARVALLSVAENIEMAMTWGNSVALATINNEDKKLTDLDYGLVENEDYVIWTKKSENSKLFPLIDYSFKDDETEVWYHPVVTVQWILEKIEKSNDITLLFPEECKNMLNQMIVPLLTREDAQKQIDEYAITLTYSELAIWDDSLSGYLLLFKESEQSNYYGYTERDTFTQKTAEYRSNIQNGKITLTGEIVIEVTVPSKNPHALYIDVVHRETGILSFYPTDVVNITDDFYRITYVMDEETPIIESEYNHPQNRDIRLYLKGNKEIRNVVGSGGITLKNKADQIILREGNNVDGLFYFVPNLPDIKQVDFIKAIASILGVFAVADSSKQITFVSIDTLTENKGKAVDWTKKVVASYKENRPYNISYVLDGFVQKNNYRWKEDDSVNGNYDHYLMIEDETLEYEDDVVTLPFAATDMYNGIAKIPLYSYDSNGEIQYKEVEPRLLLIDGTNGSFRGLDWSTLIRKYYQSYQGTIRKPVIIKEKIEIGDIGLRDIDVTVPVYLAQYGRYYAIISVKAENTGICECELLQLEV